MSIEEQTEEKIFRAAQRVFRAKGFSGARMQEIADEAGINKSMLHYYYGDKEGLFLEVFRSSVKKIMPQLFSILASEDGLRLKVEKIVEFYYQIFSQTPSLPAFVIHEMNQHPDRFKKFMTSMDLQIPQRFKNQIINEIESGQISKIEPVQFLLNVVSLCLMPMVAQNMVQSLFKLNKREYQQLMEKRRELIPGFIFNGVSAS